MSTDEKRPLWLGPVHQVATKAHAIRVVRPSLSVGICPRILSKISGGRIVDTFESGGLDPRGDRQPLVGLAIRRKEWTATHPLPRLQRVCCGQMRIVLEKARASGKLGFGGERLWDLGTGPKVWWAPKASLLSSVPSRDG